MQQRPKACVCVLLAPCMVCMSAGTSLPRCMPPALTMVCMSAGTSLPRCMPRSPRCACLRGHHCRGACRAHHGVHVCGDIIAEVHAALTTVCMSAGTSLPRCMPRSPWCACLRGHHCRGARRAQHHEPSSPCSHQSHHAREQYSRYVRPTYMSLYALVVWRVNAFIPEQRA